MCVSLILAIVDESDVKLKLVIVPAVSTSSRNEVLLADYHKCIFYSVLF